MTKDVFVAGVGMTPFVKPGTSAPYNQMGATAIRAALADAGLEFTQIQAAIAGYTFGDSASGQRTIYEVGTTGIPIFNVNNLCATGSSALLLAREKIQAEAADCVLVVGFEQMPSGPVALRYEDRTSAAEFHIKAMHANQGPSDGPLSVQAFAGAAREYMKAHDITPELLARISVKARRHAAANPLALFRNPVSVEEVLASRMICAPLTKLQCSPPTCGAAAAILCSGRFAARHSLSGQVRIVAQAQTSDPAVAFESGSMVQLMGFEMAQRAAAAVYRESGIGPQDVDVIELHDCYTSNEIISYDALGLVPAGEVARFIAEDLNTYGGQVVINPSGGLLSKGHPIGATGVAQCAELVWQLRGTAEQRQVQGARIALQHNIGPGGACVVTMYEGAGVRSSNETG